MLLFRESFTTADLCAALAHARSFGAFEHRSIERILAARAKPRRLAEYVVEEFARKLDEAASSQPRLSNQPPNTPSVWISTVPAIANISPASAPSSAAPHSR